MFACCCAEESKSDNVVHVEVMEESKANGFPTKLRGEQKASPQEFSSQLSEFSIKVTKADGKLGMRVDYGDKKTLKVVRVKDEGIIAVWNVNHPTMTLEAGDFIVAINNRKGSASELLEEI